MIFGLFKKASPKVRTAALGLATAAVMTPAAFLYESISDGAPMTQEFEGTVLKNYIDSVGVETWCTGETQLGRLDSGYTKEYCQTLFMARYPQYSERLYECYNDKAKRYITPMMHAVFTDVFYNTGAKCNTGMVRALERGDPVGACNFIKEYKKANGRDCSKEKGLKNGCYGVYDRKLKMLPKCLADAEKIPKEGIGR